MKFTRVIEIDQYPPIASLTELGKSGELLLELKLQFEHIVGERQTFDYPGSPDYDDLVDVELLAINTAAETYTRSTGFDPELWSQIDDALLEFLTEDKLEELGEKQ